MPQEPTPKVRGRKSDPREIAIRALQSLHAAFNHALDELRITQRVVSVPNIPLKEVRHRFNEALTVMDTRLIELDRALDALEEAQGGDHE